MNSIEVKSLEINGIVCYATDDALEDITALDLFNDPDSNTHASEREAIEAYAEANNLIDSESTCSERFDQEVAELGMITWTDTDNSTHTDGPAMRAWFSDFMDNQQSDGELHVTQVNNYGYVGSLDLD